MNSVSPLTALLGVAMLLVTVTVGCGGPSQDPESPLEPGSLQDPVALQETAWVVTGVLDDSGSLRAPVDAGQAGWRGMTLEFDAEGRAVGNGGVNGFGTDYEADSDGSLRFGQIASTLMAGPEEFMEQEAAFFSALSQVAAFSVSEDGGLLQLLDAQGVVVITAEPRIDLPLEGTVWNCTGFTNGAGGFVSLIAGTDINAVFSDGQISGTAGVNRYRAEYETDGDALTISDSIALTKMAGPEDAMAQEREYLAALGGVVGHSIAGGVLTLFAADGSSAVSYTAAPVP